MVINKSMYVISSRWGNPGEEKPTFRMIPLSDECPYQECIFDPAAKILAVISKIPKQSYIMTHKIDDNGDPQYLKNGATRSNGKNYKEERRVMDSYQEYYVEDMKEIVAIVNMFSFNPDKATEFLVKAMPAPPPGQISMDLDQSSLARAAVEKPASMTVVPKENSEVGQG